MSHTKLDFGNKKVMHTVDEKILRLRNIHSALLRCRHEHMVPLFQNFVVVSEGLKEAVFPSSAKLQLNTVFYSVGYSSEAFVTHSELYSQMTLLQALHIKLKLSFDMDKINFTALFGTLIDKIADKTLKYEDLDLMIRFLEVHIDLIKSQMPTTRPAFQGYGATAQIYRAPEPKKPDSETDDSDSSYDSDQAPVRSRLTVEQPWRAMSKTAVVQGLKFFVENSETSVALSSEVQHSLDGYMTLE